VAGRWALALVLVGYLAGRVRQDLKPTATAVVLTVAASSFIGTSVFALSGLLLRDPVVPVAEMIEVILVAVVWDSGLTLPWGRLGLVAAVGVLAGVLAAARPARRAARRPVLDALAAT
jgi:ABC-type antimicrobial peptide transport system permease subunit